jgi:hypothetical protein
MDFEVFDEVRGCKKPVSAIIARVSHDHCGKPFGIETLSWAT